MRVDVYWNLHRLTYSIRAADGPNKGRVIRYADSVFLKDARFVIQHAGRRKVLVNKKRSVHAWIRGTLIDSPPRSDLLFPITYDPFRDISFIYRHDGSPISTAQYVQCLVRDRKADVSAREMRQPEGHTD